jgi:hypothetical protein
MKPTGFLVRDTLSTRTLVCSTPLFLHFVRSTPLFLRDHVGGAGTRAVVVGMGRHVGSQLDQHGP